MNPERRLDQLEPLVAESLQKIDRLIEGQGQIVSEVAKIPELERTVSLTAKAVADLTVSTQRRFDEVNRRFDELSRQFVDLTTSTQQQFEELKSNQEAIMQYLRAKLP